MRFHNLVVATTLVSLLPLPNGNSELLAQISSIPGSYLVAQNSMARSGSSNKKKPQKAQKIQKGRLPVKSAKKQTPAKPAVNYERIAEKQTNREVDSEVQAAMAMAREGRYAEASQRLFQMSRSPRFADQRMQVRYLLGNVLFEMKLYQVAAFQYIAVIRDGSNRYVKQALEKLSVAADKLNDDTILNYAMSKVNLGEFPKVHQDMLRFRIGEIQMKSRLFDQAVRTLGGVSAGSDWYAKAKYLQGLAEVEKGSLNDALKSFSELANTEASKGVNHPNRVSGLMGMARVYYQQKQWDQAIDLYRQIPRDSEMWHDQLFEVSWASMQAAQFRNVLSNFHSLHSAYYEDFYIPESVLLRAIVYLYICQYDEMGKTLDLFDRIYKPVLVSMTNFLKAYSKPITYYDEVARQQDNIEELKKDSSSRRKFALPFLIARTVMKEGDYSRVRVYIDQLRAEQKVIEEVDGNWQRGELGQYSKKLINGRLVGAKKAAGKYVRDHVYALRKNLAEIFEQHGFARYEMLSGQKEQVKKRIAGKALAKNQLDEDEDRNFYIQNGYEYWPFSGEYWLDEIGNYHYLGTQKCD